MLKRRALSLLLYCLLSVAWSWPLALHPASTVVSGFDTWGSVWLVGVADHVPLVGSTELGGWPLGQDLGRADSMLLLLLLRLLPGSPSPVLVVSLLVLLGPPLTALATEFFAERTLGAEWPWSILAGLSMGFMGIASATFVDGQTYALLNPWMPLLAWSWWRATSPQGRPIDGAMAGLFWLLALLTTAYVGIAATLLVLLGALRWRPSHPWRAPLSAAAVALPLGALYTLAFSAGSLRSQASPFAAVQSGRILEVGSTQLATLAGWVPLLESEPHGVVAPLGMVVLSLVAIAPLVLKPRGPWLAWAGVGLLGVALSLGPTLRLDPNHPGGLPWLMAPLARPEVVTWFRFPSRMLWLGGLGLGAVASLTLTQLSRRLSPALLAPLLIASIAEAILLTGNTWRSAPVPALLPTAYAHAPPGPVLDLFPAVAGLPVDYELYMVDLSCAWAGQHGRPVAQLCLDTTPHVDPRARLSASLHHRALTGQPPSESARMLSELGFSAVIWRPDPYVVNEREALRRLLQGALGTPVYEGWDAGEHLLVYVVPEPSRAPSKSAWTHWIP